MESTGHRPRNKQATLELLTGAALLRPLYRIVPVYSVHYTT